MKKSVSDSISILGVQEAVTFVAAFGIHVIAGRVLGPEEYGLFSIVFVVVSIVVFSVLLGVPHAVSQALARTGQFTTEILARGLVIQSVLGLVIFAALYLLAEPLSSLLSQPRVASLLRTASISIPLTAAAIFLVYCLNGLQEFGKQALAQGSITLFRLIAMLGLLAVGLGLEGTILALPVGAAATLVFAAILFRNIPRVKGAKAESLLPSASQFNTTFIFITVWYYIDPILLEYLVSSSETVGLYMAVSTMASAPESIFAPLLVVLFPTIARSLSLGTLDEVRFYIRKSIFYIFVLMCPLVFGAAFISRDLLQVSFGEDYLPVHAALAPLTVAAFFRVGFELGDTYIRASGKGILSMRNAGIVLMVHVAAAFVLVPRFGMTGMVGAVLTSSTVAFLLAITFLRAELGLRINWTSTVKVILAAVAAFCPFFFFDPHGIWALLATIPSLIVYMMILVGVGELGKEDLDRLPDFIKPAAWR